MGEPSTRETQDGTLTLRASENGSTCVLALVGELDLSNTSSFSSELERLEAAGRPVKIDLGELEFIDSTGIAILVGAHQRLGDRLTVGPSRSEAVKRVLALTGLDQQLSIE
ncbi:MAG TPA: STAS domain-containing protein [Solirubrobacterales bacterium]